MTKKQLLAELTADFTAVTATIVGAMTTLTEWPALEVCLIEDGWTKRIGETIYDAPNNTGRYISKPRLSRVRTGAFKSRGQEYTFTWCNEDSFDTQSHGQISDLKVNGSALELTMHNGCKIQYTKG